MQTGIDTDRINSLVNRLVELTEQGVDFSLEQLPEIAREIVTWGIVSNSTIAAFALLWGALSALILCKCVGVVRTADKAHEKVVAENNVKLDYWNKPVRTYSSLEQYAIVGSCVALIPCCVAPFVIAYYLFQAAQPIFAPRLYIIEYLQGML